MTKLALPLLSLFLCAQAGASSGDIRVLGAWRFDGFYYEGHYYPRPNPALLVDFEFHADGESKLSWRRENEDGFCERRANYSADGTLLTQHTTWVNPQNAPECGRDPDMQLDRESSTPYTADPKELRLFLTMNGQEFIYLLKRMP